MQTSWKIGSLFGIPLYLDPLWFVIFAVVTLNFGFAYQTWGSVLGWSAGVIMALLLFGSVLLHELGHSLAAQSQGIKVNSITLFLFGGIAAIEEESKTPAKAFQVAIAGPLVSVGIFFLLNLVKNFLPEQTISQVVIHDLARINLVLALFNLIPGLPLDGGQVLKAALWQATGDRFTAVRGAARIGQILGYGAIALGLLVDYLTSDFGTGLWIALLGWFGIRNATNYLRVTTLQQTLLRINAGEVMTRNFRVIDAHQSLRDFTDMMLLANNQQEIYFAEADGRYRGLVQPEQIRRIERSAWETTTLEAIITPLVEIPSVEESAILADVIIKLAEAEVSWITVLSPAGAVAGIIDKGDIVSHLAEKLKLRISKEDIQRIKAEGNYPPGLQLDLLAKSAIN